MPDDASPLRKYRRRSGKTASKFFKELGVSKYTWFRWERLGVPPERVLAVERLTGISRHELRPDVFGGSAA